MLTTFRAFLDRLENVGPQARAAALETGTLLADGQSYELDPWDKRTAAEMAICERGGYRKPRPPKRTPEEAAEEVANLVCEHAGVSNS